jgi:diguanylate cyclase (GGDEF)-like protein
VIRLPVRTVAWALALVVTGVVAGGGLVLVTVAAVAPIEERTSSLAQRRLPAQAELHTTVVASAAGQAALLDAVATDDPVARAAGIDAAQQAGRLEDAAWQRYLPLSGSSPGERQLQRRYETASNEATRLGAAALVALTSATPAGYAEALSAERNASDRKAAILADLERRFYGTGLASDAQAAADAVAAARRDVALASGAALLALLLVGTVVVRRALRFERSDARRRRVDTTRARRADLETRLQRGLEMEFTEQGTYAVIHQAFDLVAAGRDVELLVADSRRGHFTRVVPTGGSGHGACQVGAPNECPAASSGQMRVFSDSRDLDTCPYLRDKPEAVWATCLPVSIAGRTNGVIHAEGSLEAPPDAALAAELELVARKSGERIGVLRVLARTEAEAQIDALTGLPNRRALQQRTRDLVASDVGFVVAFADLDHFKDLNDLHGHDTGDRALRLFARVLRDSVRPRDIPARYGGEEFLVILPDCSVVDARVVAERIRSQLAEVLTGGTVPAFTVSVGLAAAEPGEPLSEVINRADMVLHEAKLRGRDRVLDGFDVLPTT